MQYLLLVLLLFAGSKTLAAEEVVIYGDDDYPPYSFVKNGRFTGVYVEFLKQASARLSPDYNVKLLPIPWKRGLQALETGKSLALFPPYKISGRSYIQPYSQPLNHESVVIVCRPDIVLPTQMRFPMDFADLKIGINLGFALSEKLQTASHLGKTTLVENKGNDKNLLALQAGSIDCYANDRGAVRFAQLNLAKGSRQPASVDLREAVVLEGQDAYIGYSSIYAWKNKTDFIRQMDAAIQATHRTGLMEQLLRQYTQ